MYVYACVCMVYVRVCTCMYVRVHMRVLSAACVHCQRSFMHACVCMMIYGYVCMYMCTYVYVHMHVLSAVCVHFQHK